MSSGGTHEEQSAAFRPDRAAGPRYPEAAIDMAFVAAGRSDFFWEMELQPYDIAAGEIILLEAGGRVTDFEGGTDYPVKKGIVASNGIVHDKILELLAMD